jgi:hypothetical protein
MRRTLLVLLAALVLLAIAFAVLAPASLLSSRVATATGGTLAMRGVEGSVWNGRGVLEGAGAQLPLAWTFDATPLLRGEVRAQIASFDGRPPGPRADIVATRDKVMVRNVDAVLPAALIMGALGNNLMKSVGLAAGGDLAVSSPSFDWTPATMDGSVRVVWRAARLTLPGLSPLDLGDVTATLVGSGPQLAGPVTNEGGDLGVQGDVSLRTDRNVAVTMTLTPRRAGDAALTRILSTVGTPAGDGWRIAWQSTLR